MDAAPETPPTPALQLDFFAVSRQLQRVPVSNLPQRRSLVAQTAAYLTEQIGQGEWQDWLPSERALCDLLQVSRNTLRAALNELKASGQIEARHGAGNRILHQPRRTAPRPPSHDVALLTPEPIERLRPMQNLWIDDMRALLSERGMRLRVFHGRQYFGSRPGPTLQKLVTRNPHGCWILMRAGPAMQQWFAQSSVPCIVAGSTYPGCDLPFRDLDHRAMCRHAAGVFLGLGHRRLAIVIPKSARAGDLESEAGFVDGVRQSRHRDATALVIKHDETSRGVALAIGRLLQIAPLPSALLVVHPHYYLAVATGLAQRGIRVPEQISLISRDDDPFLSFVEPAPARYIVGPHIMAKNLLRPVLELMEGNAVTKRAGLIMPVFSPGRSVAAAR